MAAPEQDVGFGTGESGISRIRGKAFEAVCLAATSFALMTVLVLLLFVAADAFRPLSADPGWHLVYFLTLVVPVVGLAAYYYRLDDPAGEVAYSTTGIPIVGTLVAGALLVVIVELISVIELFALAVSTAVGVGAIVAHGRLRPRAALERLGVIILAPTVAVFGLPPAEFNTVVNWATTQLGMGPVLQIRITSLRELIMMVPVLPADWLLLVLTLTVPVAGLFALFIGRRRGNRRDGLLLLGGTVVLAAAGFVLGPIVGTGVEGWVILTSLTVPPLAFYVEGVVRRDEGTQGLVFPVVLVVGVLLGAFLVRQLGFAPPDPWLDLGFLLNATSRTPADAGIYPALVGSVMMMVVIIVATFPVGVGAAIYLEEYAPSSGPVGRIVTLIEINIGNLAGVPSVVYGLLALALFIRFINMPTGSVIVGALAVGLLILPIVIISAQEAIRAVPDSHRQASYGMGATRWQTVRNVVLPQAMPGILTGTILALGRAIGETAPLLMVGLAASVRLAPNGFFDLGAAMPRQIFSWSTQLDPAFRHGVLAAGVVTLLAVLLLMNGTAIVIRNKYQRES
ncbi:MULTISPECIES: phosphate ABC transporter permease PstA [Salinibaculum]|uniref:phosphate ABC transporter permease PstA n=1 Tax=Salinibaculum TaxID=2732368 RepID=UPI0030D1D3EA